MEREKISTILIEKEEIERVIRHLGREITKSYQEEKESLHKEPLMVVGLLKGSFIFMADLIRQIELPLTVEFMGVASYGDGKKSSGDVKIVMDLDSSVENRHLLLVEDIVDTGRTFAKVIRMLHNRKPKSLKVCTLLSKPSCRVVDVPVDFCGKEIENEFVVGYGLDYAQRFRNLPYIGVLGE